MKTKWYSKSQSDLLKGPLDKNTNENVSGTKEGLRGPLKGSSECRSSPVSSFQVSLLHSEERRTASQPSARISNAMR